MLILEKNEIQYYYLSETISYLTKHSPVSPASSDSFPAF